METISVPQVTLVDSSGKSVGVYNDDPGWWQQLKKRFDNNDGKTLAIDYQKTSITTINTISSGSKTKLITNADSVPDYETNLISFHLEHGEQLNVIGETPLHIAIMYDDLSTIKYLIEKKGYNVNQRCVGGKFSGSFTSKVTSKLVQQSQYATLAYYGEYPLALAACFSNKEVYDYLIDQGGDPNLPDSNGNTVLHVLVINNRVDMFSYATNHPRKKGSLKIKNGQELTPINLAAMIGRKELFEKMLELVKMEIWSWSTTQCSVYPLEGLDTVHSDGTILWNAALSFIVNGESEDHLDMLEIGVVKRLLGDKWATYAKKKFVQKLIFAVIHLICLSIAVYTRASDSSNLAKWPVESATTWVRYVSEAAVVIICLIVLFIQGQEIYAQGFIYYLKNLAGEPASVLYQVFCILIIIAVPFRFIPFSNSAETGINPKNVEDTLVIIAIPCGWCYLLFFARVFEITGPFVVMIYKMIIGDILTFASIYLLLLFGFSLAFYYLYKNAAETSSLTMKDFGEAIMITFQMTLGEFKNRLPEFDKIYYSDFTKVVFVAFMIIMHILLLNMLIAMMGNTYHQVISVSEKEYRRQWSHIVLLIERSFTPPDLKKFQNKYCIKLPSRDPTNPDDMVALMVIKERPKTRAFSRAYAISNWKKFYKAVFHLLKDKNLKSHELLDKWCDDDKKASKKKDSNLDLSFKTNSISQVLRKLTLTTSTSQNNNINGVACIPVHQEPKYSHKTEPLVDSVPRLRLKSDHTKIEVLNENNSLSQNSTPPSHTKAFYPNLANRIYSPLTTSFSSTKDDKNLMELSDLTRPLSSVQKKNDSFIKNKMYPKSQAPKSYDTESLSIESISSKPASFSPDSDDTN